MEICVLPSKNSVLFLAGIWGRITRGVFPAVSSSYLAACTSPALVLSMTFICSSSLSGNQKSSESKNAIYSPWASCMPRFKALGAFLCACTIYRILAGYCRIYALTISGVLSVDPSSTISNSKSGYVCFKTLLMASVMQPARLYVGMMTLTFGIYFSLISVQPHRNPQRLQFLLSQICNKPTPPCDLSDGRAPPSGGWSNFSSSLLSWPCKEDQICRPAVNMCRQARRVQAPIRLYDDPP